MADHAEVTHSARAEMRVPKLDTDFALWLATMAPAAIAAICFAVNFGGYLLNALLGLLDAHVWMLQVNHQRLIEVSIIFAGFAVVIHYYRLRLKARREAAYNINLPALLTARSLGGDDIMDKYECRARVSIGVVDQESCERVQRKVDSIVAALETGLSIAISDPVTRFSKAKMEHVLRLSMAEIIDLDHVRTVTLREMRQRRVPKEEIAIEVAQTTLVKDLERDLEVSKEAQAPTDAAAKDAATS